MLGGAKLLEDGIIRAIFVMTRACYARRNVVYAKVELAVTRLCLDKGKYDGYDSLFCLWNPGYVVANFLLGFEA